MGPQVEALKDKVEPNKVEEQDGTRPLIIIGDPDGFQIKFM
jgi:hypothetical protein